MKEKLCVVTGATSGIGYEVALSLAGSGAVVIGVGRDRARCADACARIRMQSGNPFVEFEVADLSDRKEIRALAARIRRSHAAVDVLVNNAGAFSQRYQERDGVELQFAVNYLSGFLLTEELLPLLEAAPRARVIGVSSGSHFSGRIHWDDVFLKRRYFGLTAYDQSKLAVVLFTYELAARLGPGSTVSTYAVDPGLVKTEIAAKGCGALVRLVWRIRTSKGISAAEAAASISFLATDPSVADETGMYWKEKRPLPSSHASYSVDDAQRLWSLSEKLCGIEFLPREAAA